MPIDVKTAVTKGGFLDKWLQFCEPFEFPYSYALFSLLGVASAAINGRVLINKGHEPSPLTNVFIVLYGPSGSRKGSSMWKALNLLHEAVPEAPMLPDDFTMEALINDLHETSKKKGKCSGLIFQEEFSDLIGGADYAMRNSKALTKLWDARPQSTRLTHAHGLEIIENPYICMLASSSPDWLEKTDPKTLAGGFLRRLLLIVEYGPRQRNSDPTRNDSLFKELVATARDRLGPKAFGASNLMLTPEASAFMDEWYNTTVATAWKNADERAGHFASCMQAHALKLAGIINILEGRGVEWLSKESFRCAAALISAITSPLFQAYASLVPTPYARLRAAVLRTVQGAGSDGLSPDALDQAVIDVMGVKPKEAMETRIVLMQQKKLVKNPQGLIVVSGGK